MRTKEGRKIPEGQSNLSIENKLTKPTAKSNKTNRQIIVQKTQRRKLKTKQHEPHQKHEVISSTPEGYADPAPLVAPVMWLMLLQIR